MRFVPIKNVEQQSHPFGAPGKARLRESTNGTGQPDYGLLAEFGIVIKNGIDVIAKRMPEILEDVENGLPGTIRRLLESLIDNLKETDH